MYVIIKTLLTFKKLKILFPQKIPLGDGRTYEIIVPNNVFPGDKINVVIPGTVDEEKHPQTISGAKVALGAAAAGGILAALGVYT